MTDSRAEPWNVSTEAAMHINALMDLFRQTCRLQGWTVDQERGLVGWTDVKCGEGHEFSVTALDLVSTRKPFGRNPSEPWARSATTPTGSRSV